MLRLSLRLAALLLAATALLVLPSHALQDTTIDGKRHVGEPVRHGRLALYPVIDPEAPETPKGDFATLAEALASGDLTVEEVDASGVVANLRVHNGGARAVLAMAGDVVQGGKQDRILVSDVVIPPTKEPMVIAVNCVERGRWADQGQAFAYAGRGETTLRGVVQMNKDQGATWAAVSQLNEAKKTDNATDTYRASLQDERVRARVDAAVAALEPTLSRDGKTVGVVVALDGELLTAEIYGHPSLFARTRADALRSYALDAESRAATTRSTQAPSPAAAAAFVREALTGRVVATEAQPASATAEMDAPESRAYELTSGTGEKLRTTVFKK